MHFPSLRTHMHYGRKKWQLMIGLISFVLIQEERYILHLSASLRSILPPILIHLVDPEQTERG